LSCTRRSSIGANERRIMVRKNKLEQSSGDQARGSSIARVNHKSSVEPSRGV
jgi:hypothetical protein